MREKFIFLILLIGNNLFYGYGEKSFLQLSENFEKNSESYSSYEADKFCQAIDIDKCKNLGYNLTRMPNSFGQERQIDAKMGLDSFLPLVETNCSNQLAFFLCAVHFPMCNERVRIGPILPCQSMCKAVENRCRNVLVSFGYDWPSSLNCSQFPRENGNGTMCMEGSGDEAEKDSFNSVIRTTVIRKNLCR